MNACRETHSPHCYFHPKEAVVGVCALCLKERLLDLASKQGHLPISKDPKRSFRLLIRRRPNITLPKVFALGSSFLHRLEPQPHKPDNDISDDEGSVASLEDSFISIKFEGDGQGSWEKNKKKESVKPAMVKGRRSVVEHAKPRGMLRWRKRIGQLLQLAKWKRSTKKAAAVAGHASIVAGKVEGRRGWMRSLTRRKTTS